MRAQVLGSPAANPDPDRAEARSGPCDQAAVAVLAVVAQEVADRGSATEEIQIRLQDDFGRISRRTLRKRMGDFDRHHNTAIPVGTPKKWQESLKQRTADGRRQARTFALLFFPRFLSSELIELDGSRDRS